MPHTDVMLTFKLPAVFILLPLPLLVWWLFPPVSRQQAAIRVPFYQKICEINHHHSVAATRSLFPIISLIGIWLLLITAAAQPAWLGKAMVLPTEGRDLLIAVDLSGSMRQQDMSIANQTTDRLTTVKAVLSDFIERRQGDRLGLILFGSQAYVQAPLTFDLTTVQQFLNEAQIGFAGEQTAIGDAIGLGIKRLRDRPGDRHVMILLTDGSNNAGQADPLEAAKLAANNRIVIYPIGVGADEMLVPTVFGARRINPSFDLDETTLRAIAEITGGQYFRAHNPQELSNIYQLLDELEPIFDEKKKFRPQKALFYWPLGLAFLWSMIWALANRNDSPG